MDPKVLKNKHGFAAYPSVRLKGDKLNGKKQVVFSNLKQLIFGDYIKLLPDNKGKLVYRQETEKGNKVTYVKVRARNADGYVREEDILPNRILEVNFVDIGQGDGCHVVTPEDKHFIIDAGQSDNMYRFLKWRFNLAKSLVPPPPFTVVISHSDADHYKGFSKIFTPSNETAQQFEIEKVYHNGLVEFGGTGPESLGKIVPGPEGKNYITDLVDTNSDYKKRIQKADSGDTYIATLEKTKAPKLSLRYGKDKHLYKSGKLSIEVLGPVAEEIKGKDALPVFTDKGKTKNGHSVMLMLRIGKLRIFLGGDLNTFSEDHILHQFSGIDVQDLKSQLRKKSLKEADRIKILAEIDKAIMKARKILGCDVAKSCHHGSSDFTSEFLRALNPIATVVSSGDDEPHCHPRPDTLGTLGKYMRGERSLIFSTELSRSGKEFIDLTKVNDGVLKERAVTRYGMINLRTDGEKAIIASKLERSAPRGDWDIHELIYDKEAGEFVYRNKAME